MRTVFKMPGSSSSAMASISAGVAMTLCGAGSTPDLAEQSTKKRFSAMRSCATDTPWALGDLAGRAVGGGRQHRFQNRYLITHALRGLGEHAAELAAAHHAQPGGWMSGGQNRRKLRITHYASGSFMALAASVCVTR